MHHYQSVNLNIRFEIDQDFLDVAEKQIFEILCTQRLSFNDRWFNNPTIVKLKPIIRMVGLVLCLFAALLSLIPLIFGIRWQSVVMGPELFLLFFGAVGLTFYFLPAIELRVRNLTRKITLKGSKKLAARSVKQARKLVPFTAEYDIKGGSVTYYREKDGELKLAWTRKIKGVAIQSERATIVFRKWTSFVPSIVLLHADVELTKVALREQNIDCRLYEKSHIEKNISE